MKHIKELDLNLRKEELFRAQFAEQSETNILWISPQLNGRHLYKTILPYYFMEGESVYTAITGIEKHDPESQLSDIHIELETPQLLWADIIVFPFTTQPLKHLYAQIRMVNEKIKIYYSVDYNFYQMSKEHPYYNLFSKQDDKTSIEDNMYFSDLVITSNVNLQKVLKDKLKDLAEGKYRDIYISSVKTCAVPFLIHEEIVTGNLFHEPKELIPKNGQFRLGIIATNVYKEDIAAFGTVLRDLKKKYKNKLQLVMFGFDGIADGRNIIDGADAGNEMNRTEIEFHRPTSIIQYFKELNHLNLDLVLIPLKTSDYNQTSENYNKWMECALLKIPILTNGAVFPYSKLIQDGVNGFVYKQRSDVPKIIEGLMKTPDRLLQVAEIARTDVRENFQYTEATIATLNRNYFQ